MSEFTNPKDICSELANSRCDVGLLSAMASSNFSFFRLLGSIYIKNGSEKAPPGRLHQIDVPVGEAGWVVLLVNLRCDKTITVFLRWIPVFLKRLCLAEAFTF
jgi:hypothetical protein